MDVDLGEAADRGSSRGPHEPVEVLASARSEGTAFAHAAIDVLVECIARAFDSIALWIGFESSDGAASRLVLRGADEPAAHRVRALVAVRRTWRESEFLDAAPLDALRVDAASSASRVDPPAELSGPALRELAATLDAASLVFARFDHEGATRGLLVCARRGGGSSPFDDVDRAAWRTIVAALREQLSDACETSAESLDAPIADAPDDASAVRWFHDVEGADLEATSMRAALVCTAIASRRSPAFSRLLGRLRANEARHARRGRILELATEFTDARVDYGRLLDLVTRRIADEFGDLCALRMVSDDGEWLEVLSSAYDENPDIADAAREAMLSVPQRVGEGLLGRVASTGTSTRVAASPAHFAAMTDARYRSYIERIGVRSLLAVPLSLHGTAIGVVALFRHREGADHTEEDEAYLREIVSHAALPIRSRRAEDASRSQIRERLRAEEILRRGFLEAAPDAVVIVDRSGTIVLANAQAEATFGYPRAELVGFAIDTLVPPRLRSRHAVLRSSFSEAPTTRKMGSGLELPAMRKDGSEFTAEISLSPITMADGTLVAAAIRDITGRTKSEDKFRGLLEAAPDAMVVLGLDGRIALVNAQAEILLGYSRTELLGQPIELLVPERFRDKHVGDRTHYIHAPTARPMGAGLDLFARRKDGSEFAAEISLSPIETPDGTLITAAIRDVTARKRDQEERNERIREASRLKSEFLANMSHELRTPLNAIIGFAALMHSGKAGPISELHQEYLGDVLNSSRHLLQLINDVLDLSKVESGKLALFVETVALADVVNEVVDILRGLASEKRVRVDLTIDPELPSVDVDARLLKQILYNLLSNAIKFSRDGGSVVVRVVAESPEDFRIDVEDTGNGIKPDDLGRLFVEFQQLDSGPSKRYPGTGLGLALTKRIVEAQGGIITVSSEVRRGSTFTVRLPRDVNARLGRTPHDTHDEGDR